MRKVYVFALCCASILLLTLITTESGPKNFNEDLLIENRFPNTIPVYREMGVFKSFTFLDGISINITMLTFNGTQDYDWRFRGFACIRFHVQCHHDNQWSPQVVFKIFVDSPFSISVSADGHSSNYCNSSELESFLLNNFLRENFPFLVQSMRPYSYVPQNHLPLSYITGDNLADWYQEEEEFETFRNYTCDDRVIFSRTLFASKEKLFSYLTTFTGQIITIVDINVRNIPSKQTWNTAICTVDLDNSRIVSVNFEPLNKPEWTSSQNEDDLLTFLVAWVKFKVIPFLLNGPHELFARTNNVQIYFDNTIITSDQLRDWTGNSYSKYVQDWIYLYHDYNEFTQVVNYQRSPAEIYGFLTFHFSARGNDTTCVVMNSDCPKISVESNATIWVKGIESRQVEIHVDHTLRINYQDIQSMLRGYFLGVVVPKVKKFYEFL